MPLTLEKIKTYPKVFEIRRWWIHLTLAKVIKTHLFHVKLVPC